MLTFLETNLKLDASGLNIGGGGVLTATLTVDQRYPIPTTPSFSVTVPGTAYSATVTKVTSQYCTLTITFNHPVASVHFGEIKTLVITETTNGSCNLNVEINYANDFVVSNWANSEASTSIDDIELRGPLTSVSLNNRLRALLNTGVTALNQANNYIKYYSYKQKYLSDIVDFAIAGGSSLESSSSAITYNTDGNITSIITTYANRKIKVTYTYASRSIKRLRKRNDVYSELTDETISLLDTLSVDTIDSSNLVIYNLGKIQINRSNTLTTYSIPYLKDYDATLPSDTINTDPDNMLSDYKYYKTFTIIGWTIVA